VEQELIFSNYTGWRSALPLWLFLYLAFPGLPLAIYLIVRPTLRKFVVGLLIFFAVPATLIGEAAFEYLLFVKRCQRDAMVPWVELRPMNIQSILLISSDARPDECGARCMTVLKTGSFEFVELYADPDQPDGPLAYAYILRPAGDPACVGQPFAVGRGAQQASSCVMRKPIKSIVSAYGLKYEFELSTGYPHVRYYRTSLFEVDTGAVIAREVKIHQKPAVPVRPFLRLNHISTLAEGAFACRARYVEDLLNLAAYRGRGT